MKNLSEVNGIRSEVLKYEQKLNRERLKCRALEETLQKPTNVHRWRLLKVFLYLLKNKRSCYNISTTISTFFFLSIKR